MVNFLFDCGNTCIKFAVQKRNALSDDAFVEYSDLDTFIEQLFAKYPKPAAIKIASVTTQERLGKLFKLLKNHTDIDPLIAKTQSHALGVTNLYDDPDQLGIDRWLALIAVWDLYQRPSIIADLGTALTIDHLDRDGNFSGGVIIPGIKAMRDALTQNTTLTNIDTLEYTEKLGKSTSIGVSSGIYYALLGSILIAYQSQPVKPIVIIAGGRAKWLAQMLYEKDPKIEIKVHEHLVLEGLMRYQP